MLARLIVIALLAGACCACVLPGDDDISPLTGTWTAPQGPLRSTAVLLELSEQDGQIDGHGTYIPEGSGSNPLLGQIRVSGTRSGNKVELEIRFIEFSGDWKGMYRAKLADGFSMSGELAYRTVPDGPMQQIHMPLNRKVRGPVLTS